MKKSLFTLLFMIGLLLFSGQIQGQSSSRTAKKTRKVLKRQEKKLEKIEKEAAKKETHRRVVVSKQKAGKTVDITKRGTSFNEKKQGKYKRNTTGKTVDITNRGRKKRGKSALSRKATEVINEANKYKGVRYRYGGESPKSGFDCSGFTQYVFQKEGIKLPRTAKEQAKKGKQIKQKNVQKGDLIFFGRSKNRINHVAIVVSNISGNIQMIHASSSQGITITDLSNSDYWKKRLKFFKRIIEK